MCTQVHRAVPLPAAAEKASGAELGWEPWSGAQSLVAAAQAAIQPRPPRPPPASLLLEVPRTHTSQRPTEILMCGCNHP